jgi:hypothetical protein
VMPGGTRVCILLVVSLDIAEVLVECSEVVDVRDKLVLLLEEVVI